MSFVRTLLSSLPISGLAKVTSIFDFGFNLVSRVLTSTAYYTGAMAMFELSPAPLLLNSPLLAKDSANYTFPGHPVSMRHIVMRIRNTSQVSERSGRWAAVFVPYREPHDTERMPKSLQALSFEELSSMPHAVVAPASRDLFLSYRMRNRGDYCARPREINEHIAAVAIIWDASCVKSADPFSNASFNCEIEVSGGMQPHVIFGPSHRTTFAATDFNLKPITEGDKVRVYTENGAYSDVDLEAFQLEQTFTKIQAT